MNVGEFFYIFWVGLKYSVLGVIGLAVGVCMMMAAFPPCWEDEDCQPMTGIGAVCWAIAAILFVGALVTGKLR